MKAWHLEVNKCIYALSALRAHPIDLVPKSTLEIETNFDLRLLVASMTSSLNSTFDSTTPDEDIKSVQKALCAWDEANIHYTFPASNDPSNKPGWLGYTNADIRNKLGTGGLWQAPGPDDNDILSSFQRNRLKWTEAIQSAWMNVQKEHSDYFYLCGYADRRPSITSNDIGHGEALERDTRSNASSSSAGGSSGSTSGNSIPPVAAIVTSAGYLRQIWDAGSASASKAPLRSTKSLSTTAPDGHQEDAKDEMANDFHEVCVMVGVSKSMVTRLENFGIDVRVITRKVIKWVKQTNSRYNPVSNFGLRENALEGCSILVWGRRSVAHALDCLGEVMHAFMGTTGGVGLASTSRTPIEVPRIISKRPFMHGVKSRLELGPHIVCQSDLEMQTSRSNNHKNVKEVFPPPAI